jgi:hypothetical protein
MNRAFLFLTLSALLLTPLAACENHASPSELSSELLPVLLDLAVIERAEKCADLVSNSAAFEAGKPYTVEKTSEHSSYCNVVSESKKGARRIGDFTLDQFSDCDKLRKDFEETVTNHGNNLKAKKNLFCGKDGRPTMIADDSTELSARVRLAERLPMVVKSVGSGSISSNIHTCYEETKQHTLNILEEARIYRCSVMTADSELEGVTYDALWTRAHLHDEFMDYKKENADSFELWSEMGMVTTFFTQFTNEARSQACAVETTQSFSARKAAAGTAASACM